MNEIKSEKFESKTMTHCIQSTEHNNMNPTQSINAGVAIGLAQGSSPAVPAQVVRAAATPASRKKTLVLGLLAVASCAAVVLLFKAAGIVSDVLVAIDATYKSFYT